ncbi:response regulator transcription factor [Thermogemmatispora tikiterensis]|uniref:DNA-binding response regulator n=1 Tax=Thermogemmatispora tikiterensis TaxID=1825093 RepID=A0A328VDK6_9CHLR|nr:response regulator transcription factor [Thermogemmatispora tikiterensis]RAQ94062.1 DNA-binding response regulator [Thermogemmatispora tikiterensis]
MQLLIVEDEAKLRQLLRRGLLEECYTVDTAADGEEALYKIETYTYDLVLLDLVLPGRDGLSVCQAIRQRHPQLPIIVLTARDGIPDKVQGLDAGADDYLTKPFSFAELTARIRAVLRRGAQTRAPVLRMGDLSLDPATRAVRRGGQLLSLTPREYALLEYFLRHPHQVLTKTELLEHVWDYHYEGLSNVVETYVRYLRQKLRVRPDAPELLHTIRGMGYVLREGEPCLAEPESSSL